jgi:hypothetical protein
MNNAYGFHDDLCSRYGAPAARVLRSALDRLYVALPLCAWAPAHWTFIVHAGPPLSRNDGGEGATSTKIGLIHRR